MARFRYWPIAILLVVVAAAGWQLWSSLRVDADMSAFMPRAQSSEQAYLLDELSSGEATRLWLLAISVAEPENLQTLTSSFTGRLKETGTFSLVYNGQPQLDETLRELLFQYRYLLDPGDATHAYTAESLRSSLQQGLARLRSPTSPFEQSLIVRDPTDAMRRLLEVLEPAAGQIQRSNGIWTDTDGRTAFMLLATQAAGTDLAEQEAAGADIYAAFDAVRANPADRLLVSGPPVFAIASKARIQSEARWFASLSSLLLIVFLFFVYRDWRVVLLISLPIGCGLLVATALTSALWGSVHGISIAFGITLLGVALDYPVHLFGHAQTAEGLSTTMQRIWPTMLLGLVTTVLGFTAMLTANFPGIEQLAVFAIVGLVVAALVTRYVLPVFPLKLDGRAMARNSPGHIMQSFSLKLWWLLPAVVVIAVFMLIQQPAKIFATDIQELSPIPRDLLEQDMELRRQMGLAEPGTLLLLAGDDVQTVLRTQEMLQPILQGAQRDGLIGGYDMAAKLLPSETLQDSRRAALPAQATLTASLNAAREGLPFRNDALQPFVASVAASKTLPLLVATSYADTPLAMRLNSLLRHGLSEVTGVIRLFDLQNKAAFAARLDAYTTQSLVLLDVRQITNALVNEYRNTILLRSAGTLLAIVVVLMLLLRDVHRVLRVSLTVVGAALVAASVPLVFGQALNIFHLVSLLLVVGIGLDYALFFSRSLISSDEFRATRDAVAVCAVSTILVFGMMAFSQLPVLRSIGLTVTAGSIAAFVFSILANRNKTYAAA